MEGGGQHCCHFQIGGITVRLESDLDFKAIRFKPELATFAIESPGDDQITLRHIFEWPNLKGIDLGKELYHKAPWSISRKGNTWCYRTLPLDGGDRVWHRVAMFNAAHTHGTIFSPPSKVEHIRADGWESLSLFSTDQVWLAPVLADRQAVLLHSSAAILNGRGLLFVGHSDAGKSTTVTLLKNAANRATHFAGASPIPNVEILCDDRNIVRKSSPRVDLASEAKQSPTREAEIASRKPPAMTSGEWRVYGTWSHGEVADVSAASAPLRAILFLQQDTRNEIVPLTDRKEIWKRLLATLIKPMVTAEWWQKEMNVLEQIVNEVPCSTMLFDKSGAIIDQLANL
jgi:energy-coupling factor transporter ATP-binding protein EcfA2